MPADPLGPVTIGAREIYDAVVELRAITGELRGEQLRQRDAHAVQAAQIAEHRQQTDRRLAGYADRLRHVEGRVLYMSGGAVVAGAGAGYLLSLLLPT